MGSYVSHYWNDCGANRHFNHACEFRGSSGDLGWKSKRELVRHKLKVNRHVRAVYFRDGVVMDESNMKACGLVHVHWGAVRLTPAEVAEAYALLSAATPRKEKS